MEIDMPTPITSFKNQALGGFTIQGQNVTIKSNEVVCAAITTLPTYTKTQSVAALAPNGLITYTIVGVNTTSFPLEGFVFEDPIPAGLTYVDASFTIDGTPKPAAVIGTKLTYSMGNWAVGVTHTITFQCKFA